ncbi:MAG: D-alanine--D-alanine ligase [Pseudomonadales bacterium]|nr:D-alanine--D-alanine ligase [Pseudomonadales bacterium]
MLVGLTYDLRSVYLARGYGEEETAEFDRDDTIDAIENALISLGHRTDRIGNVGDLVDRLAKGDRWDLVFNICEGLTGSARESQVPALLDAWQIPCTFSDAGLLALSLNKAWTKAVLGDLIPMARHVVIEDVSGLDDTKLPPLPLMVKPIAEGTGKGITPASVIRDAARLSAQCAQLLATYRQPVLIEEYLPGREFTVSLLGTGASARVLGTLEIILQEGAQADVYGYVNKEECEDRIEYRLVAAEEDTVVAQAEDFALRAWRQLGCRDGGRVDLRCNSEGVPCFIEVNPLAGLNPVHSDLPMLATAVGMPYVDLIDAILSSACERVVSPTGAHRAA